MNEFDQYEENQQNAEKARNAEIALNFFEEHFNAMRTRIISELESYKQSYDADRVRELVLTLRNIQNFKNNTLTIINLEKVRQEKLKQKDSD